MKTRSVILLSTLISGFATAQDFPLPQIDYQRLNNGLSVIIVTHREQPVINFDLLIQVGDEIDPPQKTGRSSLMAAVITKATERFSSLELSQKLDYVGSTLEAASSSHTFRLKGDSLLAHVQVLLDIFPEVLLHPTFPVDEIEIERERAITDTKANFDSPHLLASLYLRRLIFSARTPYGRYPSERTIKAITREDLLLVHQQIQAPQGAILVISGDVSPQDGLRWANEMFGRWKESQRSLPKTNEPLVTDKRRLIIVDKPDLTQSTIHIGHSSIRRSDPVYPTLQVLSQIFGGGGFSSRLMKTLRSDGGKTYGVASRYVSMLKAGTFGISLTTRNAETKNCLDLIFSEIDKIRQRGATEEEVDDAKRYLIGSYPMELEAPGQIADRLLYNLSFGLGIDYLRILPQQIGAVTQIQVNQAAKQYIRPDAATIIVVGNAKEIRPLLREYGAPTVIDYQTPLD